MPIGEGKIVKVGGYAVSSLAFATCRPEILTLRAYPTVPSGLYREEMVQLP
jgi:hypothetical protein